MYSTYFLLGKQHREFLPEYTYSHIPFNVFILLALISMIISWLFSFMGRESNERNEQIVKINHRGRFLSVKLLLDSGNLAKEPISGKPVIMLGRKKAKRLLSKEEYEAFLENNTEYLLYSKFRLISASGFDGEKHTYFCFRPEKLYIEQKNTDVDIDAYIAICNSEIFFEDYDGLVNPSAIA